MSRAKQRPIVRVMNRWYRRFGSGDGAFGHGMPFRRVESALHEIAHGFTFGMDIDEQIPDRVYTKHQRLSAKNSDQAEIETLALEVLVARKHRVPIPLGVLCDDAAVQMKQIVNTDGRIAATKVQQAMNDPHVIELARCLDRWIASEALR